MRYKTILSLEKISASELISIKKVVQLMRINDSMDVKAFEVFIEKFLLGNWFVGAVVMGHLPAHKIPLIAPMIEAVGANIINLLPYSRLF